jgi:hypothetical protein
MTWHNPGAIKAGESRNPEGRPIGSRNKRDAKLWEKLEARGDKDPAEFLSELVTNQNEPQELRASAANWLLPYKYSKRGATPVPPEPTYWDIEIRITKALTVTQARENLQFIAGLKLEGRISEQQADSLFAEHGKILEALIEEAKFIVRNQDTRDQIIHISGGLPPLPGTNITMPVLNGADIDGHILPAPTDLQGDALGLASASSPMSPSKDPAP